MQKSHTKLYFLLLWLCLIIAGLYVYWYHPTLLSDVLGGAGAVSIWISYAVFLLIGALRGFTLIPSTYLIILGLLFFDPIPLFILVMGGILASALSIYYFSEFMHLDAFLEKNHASEIARVKSILEKNELPIIIFWSAAPFLPTDVICYVCGTLRVDVKKFILGVFIGETVIVGSYIFLGEYALTHGAAVFSSLF